MSARSRRRRDQLMLAAFLPLALAIFVLFMRASGESPLPTSTYQVQAIVPTSVTLARGAEVRIEGVDVGRVEEIAGRGQEALLLLELEPEHAPVHRDARVDVRTRTLVGENYVELEPGTPQAGALPDGGTLAIDRAEETVQVDEVLSTFDGKTRRRLRVLLDELGGGLDGHGGDFNRFLGAGSSLAREASPVMQTLRAQRQEVASLVDDLGGVMRTLGERRDDIRLLARRSQTALSALTARDEFVARTFQELPATLEQAGASATRLAGFASRATPVLRDLRLGLDSLRPAIRDLQPAARSTRETMAALRGFAREAPSMLEHLDDFSRAGGQAIPPLRELFAEYNPLSAYLARYTDELGAFLGSMRSLTNATDATGNKLLRSNAVVTPTYYGGFTPEMDQAYQALRDIGALQETLGRRGRNAYPGPRTIGDPRGFAGSYTRLHRDDR